MVPRLRQQQYFPLDSSKNGFTKVKLKKCFCCCTEGHGLWVKQKQDWGKGCVLLLLQAGALPGSNTGTNGEVELASDFVQEPSDHALHVMLNEGCWACC